MPGSLVGRQLVVVRESFLARLIIGPSLAHQVVALDGRLLVGVGVLVAESGRTEQRSSSTRLLCSVSSASSAPESPRASSSGRGRDIVELVSDVLLLVGGIWYVLAAAGVLKFDGAIDELAEAATKDHA